MQMHLLLFLMREKTLRGFLFTIFNQRKTSHNCVDDNSPDGTGEIVKTLIKKRSINFLSRNEKVKMV